MIVPSDMNTTSPNGRRSDGTFGSMLGSLVVQLRFDLLSPDDHGPFLTDILGGAKTDLWTRRVTGSRRPQEGESGPHVVQNDEMIEPRTGEVRKAVSGGYVGSIGPQVGQRGPSG